MPTATYKAFLDLKRGATLYKVWVYQAYHEISAKYKHTALGSLWIAGSMVATSMALSLVFGVLQGQNLRTTLPFIMGGILVYSMISFIFIEGTEVFMGAAGVIKNHAYPFTYFVFEGVMRSFLTFLHNLVVFYIVTLLVGAITVPHWTLLLGIPLVLSSMFLWGTFFGMLAARFRDLRFMMPYVSQLLFFLTPIFWHFDVTMVGPRALVANLNPIYGLVEVIRSPLLGTAPPAQCWLLAGLTVITGVVAWLAVFLPFRRRIPFWV